MADWLVQNGARKIVTLVNEWAPGLESEAVFKEHIPKSRAEVIESLRMPLANPDFARFLQRARDLAPDTLFVFPANQSGTFAKQFLERGWTNPAFAWSVAEEGFKGLAGSSSGQ